MTAIRASRLSIRSSQSVPLSVIFRPAGDFVEWDVGNDRGGRERWRGKKWSGWRDSNPRPPDPQSGALARLRYIPYVVASRTSCASVCGARGVDRRRTVPWRGRACRATVFSGFRTGTGRARGAGADGGADSRNPPPLPDSSSRIDRSPRFTARQPLARVPPDQLVNRRLVGADRRAFLFELPPRARRASTPRPAAGA